jgi:PEP-CTERM motif
MKKMIPVSAFAFGVVVATAGMTAQAAVIGTEGFDYPSNQSLVGQSGGTGWDLDANSTPSAWTQESNYNPPVVNGEVYTGWGSRDRISRDFGAAIQGTGKVFFAVDVVMQPGTRTAGISWVDFGSPRKVFGLIDQTGKFGVANDWYQNPVDPAELSSLDVVFGQRYRIVGLVDYTAPDASRVKFWVDPEVGDEGSPIATGQANAFWISGINLYSGGTDSAVSAVWDNLIVATSFSEVVPEPTSLLALGAVSMAALARRRMR